MNFVVGAVVVAAVLGIGRWIFGRLKILDRPGPDIVPKRAGVPTAMGVRAWLSVVLGGLAMGFGNSQNFWALVLGGAVVVAVATRDEVRFLRRRPDLPARVRLIGQILALGVALRVGEIWLAERSFGRMVFEIPRWVFAGGFVIWGLFCINAVNWIDGINGLASGVSSVGFAALMAVIARVVVPFYGEISPEIAQNLQEIFGLSFLFRVAATLATIGEFKPKMLLRDIGTMFRGLGLAYLAVAGGVRLGTLLVALSLPLLDAVRVGLHRIFVVGKNPLRGDYSHLHYRLLRLGWTRTEVRIFVWGRSVVLLILTLLLGAGRWEKLVLALLMAGIFLSVNGYLFWVKKLPCGLDLVKKNPGERSRAAEKK